MIVRKLQKLRALSPGQLLLIGEAAFLLCATRIGFPVCGVARTQAFLRRWALRRGESPSSTDHESAIREVSLAQSRALRLTPLASTCLTRSLTLWALLLRRGIASEVRIGMRKRNEKFEGHAWLEHHGRPINENAETVSTYQRLDRPAAFDLWRAEFDK